MKKPANTALKVSYISRIQSHLDDWAFKIRPNGKTYRYKLSSDTSYLVCEPMPSKADITFFYQKHFDYDWYRKVRLLKRIQGWHRWYVLRKKLPVKLSPKVIYDIGCGHGWFLKNFIREGYQVYGIDYPGEALSHAEKLGANCLNMDLFLRSKRLPKADMISMWHSLEHFIHPDEYLRKAKSILKSDGYLVIAVPNLMAKGVEKKGLYWTWIQQPFVHIWHWTPLALTRLLEKNDFEIEVMFTRDTWDANLFYDGYFSTLVHKVTGKVIKFADYLDKKMHSQKMRKMATNLHIVAEQIFRIPLYGLYILLETLKRKALHLDLTGSELIVICKPKLNQE
jgi:SAM-dependent methyltransferase